MRQDLYRIDDVLLRTGFVTLLLFLAVIALVMMAGLDSGSADEPNPGLAALARHGPLVTVAALCPVALLGAGITFRRRERRIAAIWTLLEQNAELEVPGLLANSDFEREDLERAVHFLNNRGLGHYLWDRKNDTIQDARLLSMHLYVEKCEVCGASVSLQLPVAFREIPRCPYCHDPVSIDSLEERRREAIEALRSEHRPERPGTGSAPGVGPRSSFSFALFLILLVVFWPAALVYAWSKWQGGN